MSSRGVRQSRRDRKTGLKSFLLIRQTIFDLWRYLWVYRPCNDPVSFEFTKVLREYFLGRNRPYPFSTVMSLNSGERDDGQNATCDLWVLLSCILPATGGGSARQTQRTVGYGLSRPGISFSAPSLNEIDKGT
jgi:hypothetical protein